MTSKKTNASRQVFFCCAFLLVFGILLSAAASPPGARAPRPPIASQTVFAVDATHSSVHWELETTLHTVHGTFDVKSGQLKLDPGTSSANGEIVVDAASGKSGNDSRDKKMHKEILESPKFTEISFRPDRIEGNLSMPGVSDIRLHGVFSLHGADHEMTFPVHSEVTGTTWKGTSKFTIPYIEWGLKNPSNFLLKTKPDVTIDLELTGTVQDGVGK